MNKSKHRQCDVCSADTFFVGTMPHAAVSADTGLEIKHPSNYQMKNLGKWAVLCKTCAETHRITITSK